jgi:ParB-like chromosome segregation protein Spo0J
MAVQFAGNVNRTSEYRMLPESIVIRAALNGRHDLPDIEWLIQDILANGQHTPVVIRKDGDRPVLCAGFSRYRAVSEINRRKLVTPPMQLRCTYTQANEQEGFLLAISENHQRNALTDLDYAHNIKMLMKKWAMTEEQVALVYFPGASDGKLKEAVKFVRQRAALINLSPEAEKAMQEGRLKGSAARAIAKLSQDQQAKVVKESGEGAVKVKAPSNGHVKGPSLKDAIRVAVDKGRVNLNGKQIELPDQVVDWLAMLLGGVR